MTRQLNAATLSLIKRFEGLRLTAYPDPGSRNGEPWTIGYGSTRGVKKGDVITAQQAEARLVHDLTSAANAVSRLVSVPLNDNQFGALTSFVFNIGAGAFGKSTLLRLLNAGDYAAVPAQLARWNKNDGAVMAGLTRRRAAEARLWETPATGDPPDVANRDKNTSSVAVRDKTTPPAPASPPKRGALAIIVIIAFGVAAAAFFFL